MMRKDVQFHYDWEADVLYLSVGKPQRAKTVEMGEDFLDPTHLKIPTEGSFDPERILEQMLTPHQQMKESH